MKCLIESRMPFLAGISLVAKLTEIFVSRNNIIYRYDILICQNLTLVSVITFTVLKMWPMHCMHLLTVVMHVIDLLVYNFSNQ